jgi:hypothetical protein
MHHLFGIFLNPREQWAKIRDDNDSVAALFLKFIVLIALVQPRLVGQLAEVISDLLVSTIRRAGEF